MQDIYQKNSDKTNSDRTDAPRRSDFYHTQNPHASIKRRIDILRQGIKKNNLDAVIIFSDENRRYLSGFTGEDGNYDESAGFLVITPKDLILATDSRYKLQALSEARLYSVFCYEKGIASELPGILKSSESRKEGNNTVKDVNSVPKKDINGTGKKDINGTAYPAKQSDRRSDRYKIALETSRLTFDLYSKIKKTIDDKCPEIDLVPADETLKNLRITKDTKEIEAIKASLEIAENAFVKLKSQIHPGMTEKEAAWLLEKLIRENGGDGLSFPVIAASGPNSALPHAIPEQRRFKKNEPLLFDFGAKLNGYCSDISRTLVAGEPDERFKEAYETLFDAQKKAVEAIRPGIKCSDIDRIAREHIDNSKFNGKFNHALGHGVGIAIHEPPRLSRLDDTLLEVGMVVTVEPGIYIPEWGGIRLENMIRVTENGAEVLNSLGYDDYILSF
ncbi:MAG: aminopeptidase P family protein [Desulfamplus sp.]|nr:aminopeptidase P family protein [Desulfamplus sp.]